MDNLMYKLMYNWQGGCTNGKGGRCTNGKGAETN
jgi:hypothetical protein